MRIKKRNDTEIKKMNQHSGRIEDVDLILNALSSASEGIAIVDENDNLIYLNRAYADIFGFALEELLGIN
jgi:PAS domain-containing protein